MIWRILCVLVLSFCVTGFTADQTSSDGDELTDAQLDEIAKNTGLTRDQVRENLKKDKERLEQEEKEKNDKFQHLHNKGDSTTNEVTTTPPTPPTTDEVTTVPKPKPPATNEVKVVPKPKPKPKPKN